MFQALASASDAKWFLDSTTCMERRPDAHLSMITTSDAHTIEFSVCNG